MMSNWKTVSFAKKGLLHNSNGTNCQDSVRIEENDSVLVAALADGLGSLKYSELASQTATQAICRFFVKTNKGFIFEADNNTILPSDPIISYVKECIAEKAGEKGLPLSEMDCTLSFVCISKHNNLAIIGVLGDNAVCIMCNEKSIVLNDSNKSANGTYAVLDKDASRHLLIQTIDLENDDILGFILTSDGLENELYIKGSTRINRIAASYFNTLVDYDKAEAAIKDRINRITAIPDSPFDDDISIAILSRAKKKIDLPSDPTWLCSCGERNQLQNTYCHACHADFTALYGRFRFKDYGGKAAFFEMINAKPAYEREIVGFSADKKFKADTAFQPKSSRTEKNDNKGHRDTTIQTASPSKDLEQSQQNSVATPSLVFSENNQSEQNSVFLSKKNNTRHDGTKSTSIIEPFNSNESQHKNAESITQSKKQVVKQKRKSNYALLAYSAAFCLFCIIVLIFGQASSKKKIQALTERYETQLSQQKTEYEEKISQLETQISSLQEDLDRTAEIKTSIKVIRYPTPETKPLGYVNTKGSWLFGFTIEGPAISFQWEKQLEDGTWIDLEFDIKNVDDRFGLRREEDLQNGSTKLIAAGLTEQSDGNYRCTAITNNGRESVEVRLTIKPQTTSFPSPVPTINTDNTESKDESLTTETESVAPEEDSQKQSLWTGFHE